jgi:SAM-dependent methyltransferase
MQDLEHQTFADDSFDIVLTQDVFEHIMHPDKAIREISRTLRPKGAAIMTVPLVNRTRPSSRRARVVNGEIVNLLEPEIHGNPLRGGALVTIDWGYDIVLYLQEHSGLCFMLVQVDNIDLGIRADFNDVLIGFKSPVPDLS